MLKLFPEIEPYVRHSIKVEKPHVLAVEECGNPHGIPVLFLHGGPGAGCEPYHRQFFDPDLYRIILFDQRGCGHSAPHAELEGNTTQALVADIEVIRQHLKVDKWLVFGGSWGSTLALVYAEMHPQNVMGLVLRGIFMCRPKEIEWFYQQGASKLFPDYWQDYLAPIAEDQRHDMLHAYYKSLTGDDELTRMSAAKAWSEWEGRTATLMPHKEVLEHFTNPFIALSLARIECHYFVNNIFLEDDYILNNIDKIRDIPCIIVQGRYDAVCPMESAWELHQAWPESTLNIVADAGHAAAETGIIDALVRATSKMARDLG